MWEIFEVESKEEAKLLIQGLECLKEDSHDLRDYNDIERIQDRDLIDEIIERLG